jgi:hypothetical protein
VIFAGSLVYLSVKGRVYFKRVEGILEMIWYVGNSVAGRWYREHVRTKQLTQLSMPMNFLSHVTFGFPM